MNKKDKLLKKDKAEVEYYDFNDQEKTQLSALIALMQQAQSAQDILYSNLINDIASRYEISNATLDINMSEVLKEGAKAAKLIVKH